MSREVMRQKVMMELEEKAKRKALTNYIKKLQETEKLKEEGRYEEPVPPVKNKLTAEEILSQIDSRRKTRFQDEKTSIQHGAQIRKGKPNIWEKKKSDEYLGVMYPVDPSVLAVLYAGISHNNEGRRRYLKLRNGLDPFDRFIFSQTQNMDYGWRVEERKLTTNKQFATVDIINRTFYRRYGIKGETLRNRPAIGNEKSFAPLL